METPGRSAIELADGIELPFRYRFAAFDLETLGTVVELLNVCSRLVYGKNGWSANEMERLWTSPSANPARDAILVIDCGGQVVGFEEIFNHSSHVVLQCIGNQVHPDHRGRGIEFALLDWVVRRAEQEAQLADPDSRVILRAPIGLGDAATLAVMEKAGFAPIRYYLTMRQDLTQSIEPPSWPPGVVIQSLADASAGAGQHLRDAPDARRLHATAAREEASSDAEPNREETSSDAEPNRAASLDPEVVKMFYHTRWLAFRDHWGVSVPFEEVLVKFQHEIATDSGFDPTLFWGVFEVGAEGSQGVAIRSAGPVAVCFSYAYYEEENDASFVSDLGTLPDWRRRSLARSLLLHCFRELAQRGRRTAYLHVDADSPTGAVGLYEGVGMEVTERIAILAREIRPGRDPFLR